MLYYQKGDLFSIVGTFPDSNVYLAHACNCMGAWGAGIAAQFKELFPQDYEEYRNYCLSTIVRPGSVLTTSNNVICMFTSTHYSPKRRDSVELIEDATFECLDMMASGLPHGAKIYSPKINAGLFQVPWAHTERKIETFLEHRPDVVWTVAEL